MLARVADSLYWMGRYIERAEHLSRLSDVMLQATLDQSEAAAQAVHVALAAVGEDDASLGGRTPFEAAHDLVLDREDFGSVVVSLARARENARQVRDQITTETWERMNLIYLRVTGPSAAKSFADARRAMDDMPMGDTDYGTAAWDIDQVRAAAQAVEKRGDLLHTVVAIVSSDGSIAIPNGTWWVTHGRFVPSRALTRSTACLAIRRHVVSLPPVIVIRPSAVS